MADVRDVNLNRLAIFVAVVDAGSLTAAAARLGLAKTMVSTHIQRLEAEIGASLLVRTTRRLSVTEAGRAFYEASVKILRATEEALSAVSGETAPVRGTLRVSSPIDYGALAVAPALVELRREHPQLDVELICSDHYVDLIADGIDVAIRLGRLADSNYRAVKLGSFVKWIVASPAFVETWGMPRTPAELSRMPFNAMTVLPHPLTLELHRNHGDSSEKENVRCESAFQVNTADACRAATIAGGGFGLLTDFSSGDDIASGRLVRMLPQWSTEPASIQAIFPPTSHPPAKVRALIETFKRQLAQTA
ncbi:LysR family transcriptional regulator [Paraburkholderia metrosideri]|uniref:HTH-type transcriptional regulator DmlR n=1 Tax=Paraburkholderia metrosideri TaxID=580937 RepID=A0ABM8P328_9BURK|nr:LysR family transcriptional regulator [Paraburkholderia metrosideri]CAD6555029.1 HTH-type transcriptional regulator DmlR [Paraburkholderia metrosideri]